MYGNEYDQPRDSPIPGKYIHTVDYLFLNPKATMEVRRREGHYTTTI
jgi:hypothetical protein